MNHSPTAKPSIATFAGGCFWCMQHLFDAIPGVLRSEVGYTGGTESHPTYEEVSSGSTGHLEAIQIEYDSSKLNFEKLLSIFIHNIDPTNSRGQFADIGPQYQTAVFFHDAAQKEATENYFKDLLASGKLKSIYTKILPAHPFYAAEEYHQKYPQKNPEHYHRYHMACRRDQHLKNLWG